MPATITTTPAGEFLVGCYPARHHLGAIPGRRWDRKLKQWVFPASAASAARIADALEAAKQGWTPDATFAAYLEEWDRGLTVLRGTHPPMPDCRTKPFAHQQLGFCLIEARRGVYLHWDMGVGKSKTIVDAICLLGLHRTLIVCPMKIIPVWVYEQFPDHRSNDVRVWTPNPRHTVKRRTEAMAKVLQNNTPVAVIINYESVICPPLGPKIKTDKRKRRLIVDPGLLLSTSWDMIVADEVHRIKAPTGKTSWVFGQLAKKTHHRVGLSGTPAPNNPLDLWGQMRFVDVGLLGNNNHAFKTRYAQLDQWGNCLYPKNAEELRGLFAKVAHRVKKDEVFDLPPVTHQAIKVTLAPKTRALYDDIQSAFVVGVENGTITIKNVLTELLRLQQVTGGTVGTDQGIPQRVGTEKRDVLQTILEDLPPTEPYVAFARFTADVTAIHEAAAAAGRQCMEISGKTNHYRDWVAATGGEVLAAQIDSGKEGLNLTRACYGGMYSIGYSAGTYAQALARLDRHGQTRPVTFHHFVAENTVDVKVYQALRRKLKVIDFVFNALTPEHIRGARTG